MAQPEIYRPVGSVVLQRVVPEHTHTRSTLGIVRFVASRCDRVDGGEAPNLSVVVARTEVVEPGLRVVLLAREQLLLPCRRRRPLLAERQEVVPPDLLALAILHDLPLWSVTTRTEPRVSRW